ncbi:MAG: hypothetical protein I3274_02645 [Candidatus Moeniiplasma glomeromycotorum]|nr:hypothetical protein [Candidatus Moeniiplasma glomeromycotorum]MCE8167503.1 hypothetical protein [Candidatus Moeniiplasma glomeromycotorum]
MSKLKQLNLNPLSVAKYFYQRGIEILPINQHLIYFTYLETLKEGYLLFEEEWQAWPNGPAVESVVDKMFDHRHNLQKLFAKVEDLEDELVLNYAEKVFRKYHHIEPYLIFEKAQNKPWKDARRLLTSEKEVVQIDLTSLINFTNSKRVRAS